MDLWRAEQNLVAAVNPFRQIDSFSILMLHADQAI